MGKTPQQSISIISKPFIDTQDFYKHNLFATSRNPNTYLYDLNTLSEMPPDGSISIPLNIDTEYVSTPVHWIEGTPTGRLGITTQIRGIAVDKGFIFVHKAVSDKITRHKTANSGFHPVDYLVHLGYPVSIKRVELKDIPPKTPYCEFVLYAHFALAEAMMIVEGEYRQDLKKLMAEKSENKPRFLMQRRLRLVTPGLRGEIDSVKLPWLLTIGDKDYQVMISFQDTGAVHGTASYKAFCEASGIKLEAKDNFTSKEKSRMLEMAIERPNDFDEYALGDLFPYDALASNAENFKKIYKTLGIESYYQPPKLTSGATVRDLFQASLANKLGVKSSDKKALKEIEDKYQKPGTASELRQNPTLTKALASKVVGGRCRNNRPIHINVNTPLVDLDISGCYGEGQRNQLYFVGNPEILSYDAKSEYNEYWTLGEFIRGYEGDLVPGAWTALVTTKEPLRYSQDFLSSWFVTSQGENILAMTKYAAKLKTDSESVDTEIPEFNEDEGSLKIFNNEVFNGVVTHDFIQWLDYIASPRQRKELLEKLLVKAAIVYPASWRVNTYEDLQKAYKTHKDRNRVKRDRRGKRAKLQSIDGECHAWIGLNIGDLLIDDLIANRKLAQIDYGKKSPLDVLYKLCVNTLYGDMCSKFFESANTVVGNNITARARALAWYMEKGLYGFQTITDGCAFELNKVIYSVDDRNVNGENVVNLHREKDIVGNRRLKLAPLAGCDRIDLTWIDSDKGKQPKITLIKGDKSTVYTGYEAMNWVNKAAMEHLQSIFPNVDVLHAESTSLKPSKDESTGLAVKNYTPRKGQFEFEAKEYYDSGCFHGTANYMLVNPNGINLKMRAYETKKEHESVELEDDSFKLTDRYDDKNNPASDFIKQLTHPESIRRQVSFVKEAILKPSDYKNRLERWEELLLVPGDTFYKPGLLREFSLSQFTFKTMSQYVSWDKVITRNKEKYGQSIEQFFINPDGTLNYKLMIETVDRLIDEGVTNPFKALDKNDNKTRELHSEFEAYTRLKDQLGTPQNAYDQDFGD